MTQIKLVTLDALNTLIRLKKSPGETYAEFARQKNFQCDPLKLNESFKINFKKLSLEKPCYMYDRRRGDLLWWTRLIKNCFVESGVFGETVDDIAQELFEHYASVEPWELIDAKVSDHLKVLKEQGIHIGVISNFDSRLSRILNGFRLCGQVELMLLSGEIGIEKPNKRIFELAARYFKLTKLNQMLHVGDHMENDYQGAIQAGARGLLFNPAASIEAMNKNMHIIQSFAQIFKHLN